MKNALLITISLLSLSAFTTTASAQNSLRFSDNINLAYEARQASYASSAPIHFKRTSKDEALPGSGYSFMLAKYASMLKTEAEALSNTTLYALIDDWFGTRYRYGGSTKKGIDCSSLTGRLMKDVYNIVLPRTAREQYAACHKIPAEALEEGDLVFFNTRGGVSHVGFFLSNGYFVHASSSNGVTISNLEDNYYKNRFVGAGRINTNIDYTRILL
jgi:cell wall-associated NlpC family hydrolase